MKHTHDNSYGLPEEINQLVSLFNSQDMIDDKIRVNLYLPKGVVKLMDLLAKDISRGAYVSKLIVKEAGKKQTLPYGMFRGTDISEEEIDEITDQWEKILDEV
ncbi:hypothetical protein HY407_03475 [Candidatus Gottesmanbacteria bacterium]|nr:hypothetical protein [Candidatus Gottesmanbacteria bacterium]